MFRNDKMSDFDKKRTVMVMAWGQFVTHDLILTPNSQGKINKKNPHTCNCFSLNINLARKEY